MFVHRASIEDADKFFAKRWDSAPAIADRDGDLFRAFGLGKGTFSQLVGLRAIGRAFVAMFKGHFIGKPTGNETQMPGAFLLRDHKVLWAHRATHTGDHPDIAAMLQALDGKAPAAPLTRKQRSEIKKLEREHMRLLTVARDLQRNGDIQAFATATADAEQVAQQIDTIKGPVG